MSSFFFLKIAKGYKFFDIYFSFYYRSISFYKGYFIKCNTNLYSDNYRWLCINNIYDKYRVIKSKYSNYIVLIKYKNIYYTYDNLYGNNILFLMVMN